MKKISIILLFIVSFANSSKAQVLVWDSVGDQKLTFLQGETRINVQYSFGGVTFNGKQEYEFLDTKTEDYNNKKAGRRDDFSEHWQDVKTKTYPEHFEKSFKKTAKKKMKISNGDNEKYKMVIRLLKVKTGEGSNVKNATIAEFEIMFVEGATNKVLAKARMSAKGTIKTKKGSAQTRQMAARTMNMDMANRLEQCFDVAGTATARYIVRFNKRRSGNNLKNN